MIEQFQALVDPLWKQFTYAKLLLRETGVVHDAAPVSFSVAWSCPAGVVTPGSRPSWWPSSLRSPAVIEDQILRNWSTSAARRLQLEGAGDHLIGQYVVTRSP
ncbi:hypothetical protein AB0M43_37450 [Longispora sp. NPDC051575]|uniref:hypothetical protein n=1 Tax=Longispora sp. NPDC051575 TaxID=3154943 RepID=UPI003422AA2F